MSAAYPLALNTGRIRDQWHTMTRTAKTPRLMSHLGEPFVQLHPADAAAATIQQGDLVEVRSPHGAVIVRATLTESQRRGSVFVPMHWTDQLASNARIDAVIESVIDPVSGQPELKHTPVSIAPVAMIAHALLVTALRPAPSADYWTMTPVKQGWRSELSWRAQPSDWSVVASSALGTSKLISYSDEVSGTYRFAAFDGDRVVGILFVSRSPVGVDRAWAAEQLATRDAIPSSRLRVLAGRSSAPRADHGPTVCACFDIGLNQIVAAITSREAVTVDAVGTLLKAGTNCGSCRSEIKRLISVSLPS